ncbi:MAG: hypothetical protein ACD_45C00426G0005 [uncultured bacterium]|nr:MAG: hypothetical protein ACD_45C00426G0005 [uncultured bacterium]
MTKRDELFKDQPLEKVADVMAGCLTDSINDRAAQAEFCMRQTRAVIDTADATKKYTKYMFWSVVILAVSSVVNVLLQVFKLCPQ